MGAPNAKEGNSRGRVVLIVDANPRIDPRYCQESVRAFSTIEMIERSYYICFHQGRAFTFLTIMNVLQGRPPVQGRDLRLPLALPGRRPGDF